MAGNRPSPERPGTAFPRCGAPNPATPRLGCKVSLAFRLPPAELKLGRTRRGSHPSRPQQALGDTPGPRREPHTPARKSRCRASAGNTGLTGLTGITHACAVADAGLARLVAFDPPLGPEEVADASGARQPCGCLGDVVGSKASLGRGSRRGGGRV